MQSTKKKYEDRYCVVCGQKFTPNAHNQKKCNEHKDTKTYPSESTKVRERLLKHSSKEQKCLRAGESLRILRSSFLDLCRRSKEKANRYSSSHSIDAAFGQGYITYFPCINCFVGEELLKGNVIQPVNVEFIDFNGG